MKKTLPLFIVSSILLTILSFFPPPACGEREEPLLFHPHKAEMEDLVAVDTDIPNRQLPEEDEPLYPERRLDRTEWDLNEILKPPDSVPLFSIGYTDRFTKHGDAELDSLERKKTITRAHQKPSEFVPSGPIYTGPLGLLELLRAEGFRPDATFQSLDIETFSAIPLTDNKKVRAYIKLFSETKKKSFQAGIRRSGRYLQMIRKVLHEEGLPPELAYLPMIESNFKTYAVSRAKAKGMWQFIRGTGRKYGLRSDWWVDERYDPIASTRAASSYLRDLSGMFGDWHLPSASYTAG